MPAAQRKPRRFPRWLLLVAVLVGVVHQVWLPPFLGEDEAWHLEAAELVANGHPPALRKGYDRERRLEVPLSVAQVLERTPGVSLEEVREGQERLLAALDREGVYRLVDWAEDPRGARSFDAIQLGISGMQQPPVYRLITGAWLSLCPTEDPAGRLRFARLLSLLAYGVVVFAAFALADAMGLEHPELPALMVALWPMHARQAATVNPDVFANAFVALTLLFALRAHRTGRRSAVWTTLALAAVSPFVKSTAVTAWVGPLAFAGLWLRRSAARGNGRNLALVVGGAALLAGLFVVALWSGPVIPQNLGGALGRLRQSFSPENLHELTRTSAGAFAWGSRTLPAPGMQVFLGALALGALGCVVLALRRAPGLERFALLLAAGLCSLQLAAVIGRGAAAARYLHPALPGFAALWCAGYLGLFAGFGRRVRGLAVLAMILALFFWHGFAFTYGPLGIER